MGRLLDRWSPGHGDVGELPVVLRRHSRRRPGVRSVEAARTSAKSMASQRSRIVYLSNPALTPPGTHPDSASRAAAARTDPVSGISDLPIRRCSRRLCYSPVTRWTVSPTVSSITLPACQARFNPATATYTDYTGALGPANTTYPLQCPGRRTQPACCPRKFRLPNRSSKVHATARAGQFRRLPALSRQIQSANMVHGYAYDGGWL